MRSIIDHFTPQIITDPIWNLLNMHLYEHFQEYFFCSKVILNPNYNNKFYASCLVTSISGFQILKTISQYLFYFAAVSIYLEDFRMVNQTLELFCSDFSWSTPVWGKWLPPDYEGVIHSQTEVVRNLLLRRNTTQWKGHIF